MKRIIPVVALAALVAVGCSTSQPGPDAIPQVTAAQQCQILQTAALTAETGVLLAKIKNADARMAVNAALAGVQAGAASYCEAVARQETPDALQTVLLAFNAALVDLNAQLRAAQATG